FAGTASECAQLLEKIVAVAEAERANVAVELVKDHRARKRPIPGFGHPIHRDLDPRSKRLIDIVKAAGATGEHVTALETLEQTVLTVIGKRIVTNVSAAIAVALYEASVPSKVSRGIVLTT